MVKKMKIFVVTVNPKEKSKKEIYVQTYIEEARKLGHEVRVVNLYDLDIGYLKFNGEDADQTLSEELKQAQDNMVWADQLVIVYPLWCFGMPAILKAFIERVFQADVIWKFGKYGPEPVHPGKTSVIIQSYSMPYFFMRYMLGDCAFKYWTVLLSKWSGFKVVKRFDLDMIDDVSEKRKQKWLGDIKKFLAKL